MERKLNSKKDIEKWLLDHNITNYKISKYDNSVNVYQDVEITDDNITELFVNFNLIKGDFKIIDCPYLLNYNGFPKIITGDYDVTNAENLKFSLGNGSAPRYIVPEHIIVEGICFGERGEYVKD